MDSGGDKLKRENAAQKVTQTDRFRENETTFLALPLFVPVSIKHSSFFSRCVVQKDIETNPPIR